MKRTVPHEFHTIFTTHWNDNLFPWQFLSCHLDTQFSLRIAIDYVLDLVNFFCTKSWKSIFNFDDFRCAGTLLRSLCIWFLRLFCNIGQFDIFEIFGDLINLLWSVSGDRGRIFLILAGISLLMDLLFLLEASSTFRVNFAKIFCLRVFEFLSAISESYLD